MYTEQTERRSSLALLPGVVDQPGRTMAQLLAFPRRRWLVPAILCLVSLVILLAASAPLLAEQAAQQQAEILRQVEPQLEDMTQSQREQMEALMTRFSSPAAIVGISLLTGLLGMIVGWTVGTGIIYFGLAISGRDLRLSQVFAAFSWTWLPFCLRDLVNAGWVLVTGSLVANPGLSYLFATGDAIADAQDPLWILSSYLDLFALWHLVLVYFLVRATSRRGGGLGLTLVYAAIALLVRVLPRLLGGTVTPSF